MKEYMLSLRGGVCVWIMITILIGTIGALAAIRLKVPAGAIVGSLTAVVIFNIFTGIAVFPQDFKTIAQIGTGAYIGARICKKDVYELKAIILPAIILTVTMCIFNIGISIFLSNNTNIDLVTALFATAPAGITDMTLISVDFGAKSSSVAALQLVRIMSAIIIMPSLIKCFIALNHESKHYGNIPSENNKNIDLHKNIKELSKRTVYTLIVAFIFGYMGYFLGIPAGAISLSMIASAFYNIKTSKAYIPVNLRKSIQVLCGCMIGARITMEQVIEMKELLPSIIVIILGYIILNFVLAFLITKFSTVDSTTALYASSPGGLTDMAIIASEMGADVPKVVTLQFTRIVSVIAFYPIIIKVLLSVIK